MKYIIMGPDGIPLRPDPFPNREAAQAFIPLWCAR